MFSLIGRKVWVQQSIDNVEKIQEKIKNDDLYCRFIQLIVVNNRKSHICEEHYYDHILL